MKLTPTSLAARSSYSATARSRRASELSATSAIGVTEMRLLMIGMPYSRCDFLAGTAPAARPSRQILS